MALPQIASSAVKAFASKVSAGTQKIAKNNYDDFVTRNKIKMDHDGSPRSSIRASLGYNALKGLSAVGNNPSHASALYGAGAGAVGGFFSRDEDMGAFQGALLGAAVGYSGAYKGFSHSNFAGAALGAVWAGLSNDTSLLGGAAMGATGARALHSYGKVAMQGGVMGGAAAVKSAMAKDIGAAWKASGMQSNKPFNKL